MLLINDKQIPLKYTQRNTSRKSAEKKQVLSKTVPSAAITSMGQMPREIVHGAVESPAPVDVSNNDWLYYHPDNTSWHRVMTNQIPWAKCADSGQLVGKSQEYSLRGGGNATNSAENKLTQCLSYSIRSLKISASWKGHYLNTCLAHPITQIRPSVLKCLHQKIIWIFYKPTASTGKHILSH